MKEIERLKEEILNNYPRLSETSSFRFSCHPGVGCFNDCCGDVNIFLTPYDILRLKKNLGISSQEFLSEYTTPSFDEPSKHPVILLRMNQDDQKSCPFVGRDGCRVYEDRPCCCRMYPLGQASPKADRGSLSEDFFFLLEDGGCKGFEEDKSQTVGEWLGDQGISEYNEMGVGFKELTLHEFFEKGNSLSPEKTEMFCLCCYDLDRFRDFVFGSTFFEKFEIDAKTREKIREDDVELLKFGYNWLRFALFGERTLEVKRSVLDAKKSELDRTLSGPREGLG